MRGSARQAVVENFDAYHTQMVFLRILTLVTWLAVGVSAVMWFLPWWTGGSPTARPAVVSVDASTPAANWSSMLGKSPAAVTALPPSSDTSRFQLVGVAGPVAPARGSGVALLSVDGKPPRAYKAGDGVDDRLVVLDIAAHTVKIGPRGSRTPSVTLQAPLLPPAATGTPTGAATGAAPVSPPGAAPAAVGPVGVTGIPGLPG